ncbi:protein DpdH [Tautonia plasticadhaerens]|uniref:Uncharacterized protein n=1 Tax=Tautonia plasticadhaerens TaxID=2527974 RepID=A0A518H988_9BACT|nr:protein DpdH [Tautonia plasticadhaerens]QDV37414.1 hypothetical protein ElP_53530 [Tautonia plasticadhaerens]
MPFRRFVCWQPAWVEQVMDTEALQPADHVFAATHHPVKMSRSTLTALYGGDRPDRAAQAAYPEEQLLRDFLAPKEFAFVPVLGEAGTGKSHLIRWLASNVPRAANRHVLLIPKVDTNLRDVLDRILRLPGTDGPRFDDYRSRLFRATSELRTEREAREKLLNNLAVACGPNGPHQMRNLDEVQEYLVHNLPNLLYDPFFRDELLRDGGIIHHLVQHTIGNVGRVERLEEKRGFKEEDLPLRASDIQRASQKAADFYSSLIAERMLQIRTVSWLNAHLSTAIAELLELRGDALLRLMLEVREALAANDTELILLVEDFAKLQGIDMQLLEAIIAKPRQEGRGRLCVMRTALACTTGYFRSLFQTVQTRVDFCVALDVQTQDGTNGVTPGDIEQFVARYLNASRLGDEQLARWHDAAKERRASDGDTPPIACEACEHREECHQAFGTSAQVGLYPFTTEALSRMLERASPEGFNPRLLLKDVLRRVLVAYEEDLREGRFPSPPLLEHFKGPRLSAPVKEALLRRDPNPATRDRRMALVDLWTDGERVADLDPGIHEAFDLPPLGDGSVAPPEPERPVRPGPRPPQPDPEPREVALPARLDEQLRLLNEWQNGGRLSQNLVNELRDLVFEAVQAHIDWDSELLVRSSISQKSGMKPFKRVSVNFHRMGTAQGQAAVLLVLPTDGRSFTDTAISLQALLLFRHHGNWRFEFDHQPGSYYFRWYAQELGHWSDHVLGQLRKPRRSGEPWDPVPAAAEVLAITARMAGRPPASKTALEDHLGALFTPVDGIEFEHRTPAWRELFRTLRDQQQALIDIVLSRIACTKGGFPRVQVIDASRLVDPMRSVRRDWTPHEGVPDDLWDAYSAVRKAREKIDALLPRAIEEERTRYLDWSDRVTDEVGADSSRSDLIQAVQETMRVARDEGVFGGVGRERYEAAVEAFRRVRFDQCLEAMERLRAGSEPSACFVELSRDYHDLMASTDAFIEQTKQFLNGSLQRVESEIAQLEGAGELQATQQEIEQQFTRIEALLGDVAGGMA